MLYKSKTNFEVVPMFGLAQQSNGEGGDPTGSNSSILLADQPNSWIYWKPDNTNTPNGSIQQLRFGRNQLWRATNIAAYSGMEMSFGYRVNQITGGKSMLLKYCRGGASLVDDGQVDTDGLFQIDASAADANNQQHYIIWRDNFLIPCIQLMRSRNQIPLFKGMIFMGGEGDSAVLAKAQGYELQLTRLANAMKADITALNCIDPNYMNIAGRVNANLIATDYPYLSTVRTAQANAMMAVGGHLMDFDNLTLATADTLHYTKASQEAIGIAMANVFYGQTEARKIF